MWNQSLGPTVGWRGNSLWYASATSIYGLETSGMLVRVRSGTFVGAWVTANSDGTFTGVSSACYLSWGGKFSAVGNIITYGGDGFIVYNPSSKQFSGGPAYGWYNSYGSILTSTSHRLGTGGGLVRAILHNGGPDINCPYISLT